MIVSVVGRTVKSVIGTVRGRMELGFVPPPVSGMQNYERMTFLHQQVLRHARRRSGVALEIGCFEGGSTVYLAKACQRRRIDRVTAMDLFTGTPSWGQSRDTEATARQRIAEYGLDRVVTFVRADSRQYAWDEPIDVLHIDGDHAYEAVRADAAKYVPFLTEGGIVVFDDYDAAHPGVLRAVHELLVAFPSLEIVGLNYQGSEYGSICLRRGPDGDGEPRASTDAV
jgi:predicted O-methyltransferase YrrM